MNLLTNFIFKSKKRLLIVSDKYIFMKNNRFISSAILCEQNVYDLKHFSNQINLRRYSDQNINEGESHKWLQPSGVDSGISVYNCVAKKKVPLIIKNDFVTWYSCGPTVYDSAHIGHASCYVKLDIIQRILRNYFQLNLVTCMGVTDIDDKIIQKSIETGVNISNITKMYEEEFWKNLSDLNVMKPDFITRVTDHMPTIINFIKKIMDKNLCYVAQDKSLYFDTESFGHYGKLQKAQKNSDKVTAKNNSLDFALWKSQKKGEPFWETEWGEGRPGWHIECSAMASRLFGDNIDFHAGGVDLQFPHHENEEAQSCAFHGNRQWINYWIHTGHLHLKGDLKMSKSLKNTISINDFLKSCSANVFRMACLMSNYRYSMEFSDQTPVNAKSVLSKIKQFLVDSNHYVNSNSGVVNEDNKLLDTLKHTKLSIDSALKDDFDTSKCIDLIIKLILEANKVIISKSDGDFSPLTIASISKYIVEVFDIFGINLDVKKDHLENTNIIDAAVNFRKNVRMYALKSKDQNLLKECDSFRNTCALNKIKINDKPNEASWIIEE